MSEKIRQNSARLRAVAADYESEIARIDGDERASDAYKAQQREDAHARAVERAFVTAAQVWGAPTTDQNYTKRLDESGLAWQAQAAAVAKLEQARQTARRSAIDPEWFPVANARAQALVRQAQTGDELLQAYAIADPDVRAVLAEFGESL